MTVTVRDPVSNDDDVQYLVQNPKSIEFDSGNWNQPRTVTVHAGEDDPYRR